VSSTSGHVPAVRGRLDRGCGQTFARDVATVRVHPEARGHDVPSVHGPTRGRELHVAVHVRGLTSPPSLWAMTDTPDGTWST
jgi:hypothetical protein